jgi:hypothetical protein
MVHVSGWIDSVVYFVVRQLQLYDFSSLSASYKLLGGAIIASINFRLYARPARALLCFLLRFPLRGGGWGWERARERERERERERGGTWQEKVRRWL